MPIVEAANSGITSPARHCKTVVLKYDYICALHHQTEGVFPQVPLTPEDCQIIEAALWSSYDSIFERSITQAVTRTKKKLFKHLLNEWESGRQRGVSVEQMSMHPSYQRIVGMGQDAVPFLLEELERKPRHLFWALHAITGADPVPEQSRGKIKEMANAWIEWGRGQGYSW